MAAKCDKGNFRLTCSTLCCSDPGCGLCAAQNACDLTASSCLVHADYKDAVGVPSAFADDTPDMQASGQRRLEIDL